MGDHKPFAENLRVVWAIAAKDIVDAIKNKTTISIIIGVAFLLLSGQAMPLLFKLQAVPRAYYYDPGGSESISELAKGKDYQLIEMPSREDMEKVIGESSGAVLGLVIPPNFDQQVESGGIVQVVGSYVHWAKSEDVREAVSFFEQRLSLQTGATVEISKEGAAVYPALDADGQPFMFTLSLVVATITIGAFLVPLLMVEEKEKHTMEALMVSPASYNQIVLGKTIAGIFYCLTAAAVVLAINYAMVTQWWLVILAVLGGAFFTVSIGLLVGTLFDHQGSMNLWLGLILILLIMPVFLEQTMGERWPQTIATIIPWVPSVAMSDLVRMSLTNNFIFEEVVRNLAILSVFTGLILTGVIWCVRRMDR
jgi:ABC-2 type transport system permease protein